MTRWLPPVLACALILTACASEAPKSGPDSGIRGTVLLGPRCPVVRQDSPCPDTPWVGTVSVSRSGDGQVSTVQTSAQGTYAVALDPGAYNVVPVLPGSGGPPFAGPVTVVVHAHEYTKADLTVDTGIR